MSLALDKTKRCHCLPAAAVAVLLLLWISGSAASAPPSLAENVEAILSGGPLGKAKVGIHVVAPLSGRVIYSRDAMRKFIAASNEKLVTAATALEALGQDYQFKTAVYGRGAIEDGVLHGDLVLRGGGDPTIGGRYDEEDAVVVFRRWARVLKAKGVRRVAGDLVADDRFFDRVSRHPSWSAYPAWKWYYSTVSALSINDNCVTVNVKPGAAASSPAVLAIAPGAAPVRLLNACRTHTTRHAIWFDRQPGSDTIKVGGYVRLDSSGYSHDVTVPDPPLYTAAVFKRALEDEGIRVEGRARVIERGEAPPLSEAEPLCVRKAAILPVLRTMMKRSHNHYAEHVIKTVGAETAGVGSWEAGLGRSRRLLESLGFSHGEFDLSDGSGLSRHNRLTPALITALLVRMGQSEHGAAFRSLLAVAGRDGTLRTRLTEQPYAGNVRAKTGYLNGVGALSGYAITRSGIEVAFCILINDAENPPGTYSMREALDSICRAIVDYAE